MRILALADEPDKRLWEHLDKTLLEGVDLVISCGDLPAEYLSFLTCFTHAPILYVHGNHDIKYLDNPPEGCECIDDRIVKVNGIRIMGLGGSIKYKKQDHFMYTERKMRARIRDLRFRLFLNKGVDIVVTHAPPRGVGDGDDFAHMGFECFKPLMTKYKPRFLLHGHMHSDYTHAFIRERLYDQTRVINAGPKVFIEIDTADRG